MGQDDSCGICGKHYRTCRHYIKEHLSDLDGLPLCGGKTAGAYFNFSHVGDTGALCLKCHRVAANLIQKDFGQFCLIVQENS